MADISIEHVLADNNLLQVWYKVRANQGCAGIDHVGIQDFERKLFSKLALLKDEVIYDTYRPLPLFRVHVPKKSGGFRALSIPAVRDRVLHTAVAIILTPVFEAEFEDCSYAYRQGRSVDMAIRRIEQLRDQGFSWVVDADIHSYFDEIDHHRLLGLVEELVTDPAILHLIRLWLKAVVVDGKSRFTLNKGVPQGSPLSPLLANLYLDKLDEAMLGMDLRIIRFADDFLILCRNKKRAQKALEFTVEVLEALKLRINKDKSRLVNFTRGFRFLGVDFVRSLAIKTKYPDLKPLAVDTGTLAAIPVRLEADQTSVAEEPPLESSTALGIALSEAGIDAADFPEKPEPVMELEARPDGKRQEPVAEHDPLLRTLYLLAHGTVLGKESERFTIKNQGTIVQRVLAIKVDQIMVFGNTQITTQAMRFCLQEKIPIFLLSGHGRYYGVVDGFDTDPVLLHRDQFARAAQPDFCLLLARQFIRGKIANCRVILLRYRRRRNLQPLADGAARLRELLNKLDDAVTLDQLRGYEGTAARTYFKTLSAVTDPDWKFSKRTRQPPRDPVNSMLSYGYTLLFYNLYSLLRARGLNPQVGFLHPLRPGHPALVSDLIEEFRSIVVDTVVLNLVLNRRITPSQFTVQASPGTPCLLGPTARSLFIRTLEKKFNAPLIHPRSGLHLDYRRCMEHQVQHLASVIQGHEQVYQPLVLK